MMLYGGCVRHLVGQVWSSSSSVNAEV